MRLIRDSAHHIATIALVWHIVAVVAVSTTLSCGSSAASEHAGLENCPLHRSMPACPLHGDKHGTHECDCPTIGCAQTDTGLLALLGVVAILPTTPDVPVPLDAGDASPRFAESANLLPHVPLSPPPRV